MQQKGYSVALKGRGKGPSFLGSTLIGRSPVLHYFRVRRENEAARASNAAVRWLLRETARAQSVHGSPNMLANGFPDMRRKRESMSHGGGRSI